MKKLIILSCVMLLSVSCKKELPVSEGDIKEVVELISENEGVELLTYNPKITYVNDSIIKLTNNGVRYYLKYYPMDDGLDDVIYNIEGVIVE